MKSFGCMPAVRTPEASRTLTASCPGILPSPLRDKVGAFHHDRFRGYVSVHFRSGLPPPCLRFAVAVAGHHARLGTRLLVRLCRGRHRRRLNSMRLQGATRTEPYVQLSCIRLPPRMFDGWPRPSVRAPASVTRFSRHCVRHVRHRFAFSLASALRSTASAAGRPALFGGFIATMAESDFSCPCIIGFGSSPSRCGPVGSAACGRT
jgi:hypothetical protein